MTSKKQQTQLGNFKVPEVSIVDRGANKKRPFPIFKQEKQMTTEEMETILKAVRIRDVTRPRRRCGFCPVSRTRCPPS
jgi:hypothetical protein